MKKYIAKVKERGEEYTKRVVIVLAGVSTLAVVIIWLLLVSLLPKEEKEVQVQDQAPDFNAFFNEAQSQLTDIAESFDEVPERFNQAFEEQLPEELAAEELTETNE